MLLWDNFKSIWSLLRNIISQSLLPENEKKAKKKYIDYLEENSVWYYGEPEELADFYKDKTGNKCIFWKSAHKSTSSRTSHFDLAKIMVDNMTNLVMNGMSEPSVSENGVNKLTEISAEINWHDIGVEVIRKQSIYGYSAMKGVINADIQDVPIVEVYDAQSVDKTIRNGVTIELIFKDRYPDELRNELYELHQYYGFGYIRYKLFRIDSARGNVEVPLTTISETSQLVDITFSRPIMFAEEFIVEKSLRFDGRGESMYASKLGIFDSLDESVSALSDEERSTIALTYIPSQLIPKSSETGNNLEPSRLLRYIAVNGNVGPEAKDKITVESPQFNGSERISTFTNWINSALLGIMSPSSLGFNVSRVDNAEAQREKQNATSQTRDKIIYAFQSAYGKFIEKMIQMKNVMDGDAIQDYDVKVQFSQLASPSFEEQLGAYGKGISDGAVSRQRTIEDLYAETWTLEEKEEEFIRQVEEHLIFNKGIIPTRLSDKIAIEKVVESGNNSEVTEP